MKTPLRDFSHATAFGQTAISSDQGNSSFVLYLTEGTRGEISDEYSISLPDDTSRQGILYRKSKKDADISNQKQSWADEGFKAIAELDVMADEEDLPPPDFRAKACAEVALSCLVRFPQPFPPPQIYVDDNKAIVLYFVWQQSFVSLNIWSDKIWCLSTINGDRRECLSPSHKTNHVVKHFLRELHRLMRDAQKEE